MAFSYSSIPMGVIKRLREFWNLYRAKSSLARKIQESVGLYLLLMQRVEKMVLEQIGIPINGLKILEIGPGQKCHAMLYFSSKDNHVTGIDLDEIISGFDPVGYYRMWRKNGIVRVIKTLGQQVVGTDEKFTRELIKQLGISSPLELKVLAMDASNMTFPDAFFDFVYSHTAFEHLIEPGKVIDEVVRVLKPGGGTYLSIHLYTSASGCHDPRIFAGNRSGIPLWSHLRPQYAAKIQPNAYLNQLSMKDWNQLFSIKMPGVFMESLPPGKVKFEQLQSALKQIKQQGELLEYTDDELLTVLYIAIWRKPKLSS